MAHPADFDFLNSTTNSSSSSAMANTLFLLSKNHSSDNNNNNKEVEEEIPETAFEFDSDAVLALAFLITAIVAAKRMSSSHSQGGGGAETTVVTAFYSLILLTSTLRTLWFLIPSTIWSPYYTPHAVMAFDAQHYPQWKMTFFEILLQSAGSLSLFSIFILILVYWADILKKYFYPGARRSKPMTTFVTLVLLLASLQCINAISFLLQQYSTEGMILANSITLSIVSMVCVTEITIFSHRFRTVLKTLGDINQVSTESQVKRIVWITVTGNAFFFTRAFLETIFSILVGVYWYKNGNVALTFTHRVWDIYILLKHWSELAILALMLYILQSRFATATSHNNNNNNDGVDSSSNNGGEETSSLRGGGGGGGGGSTGYQAIGEADPDDSMMENDAFRPTLSV